MNFQLNVVLGLAFGLLAAACAFFFVAAMLLGVAFQMVA